MRRALLALLTLAIAGPALGQSVPAKPVAKPKPVAMASQVQPDTQSYVLPPLAPLSTRPGGDAGQCRASCAKQYYFCGSEGDDGSCGGRWAQCNASCNATWTAPRFR